MKRQSGFTLLELMVVVIMVAIIAAIAIPSYQQYIQKKELALVQQEMQFLATQLERYKSKNFSFKGFKVDSLYKDKTNPFTGNQVKTPIDATNKKYTITIVDGASNAALTDNTSNGLSWTMIAVREDTTAQAKHYDLLINSNGVRCMTKTTNIITTASTDCGENSENW